MMRDLINKLTLLESDGNNIPKISEYLKRRTKNIIELYFYTKSPKKIKEFGENTFGNNLSSITVSMLFKPSKHDLGTLEFYQNKNTLTLKCTVHTDGDYYFDYKLARYIGEKIFNHIGFTEKTVNIGNADLNIGGSGIVIYIPQTDKLLEVINAAFGYSHDVGNI